MPKTVETKRFINQMRAEIGSIKTAGRFAVRASENGRNVPMTKIMTSLLAGTAFFGLAAAAQAADMASPLRGPTVVPSVAEPASAASGWYLRGDVGVVIDNKAGFSEYEPGIPKSIVADKLWTAPSIGLGVGYQFNEYLRGDLTGEFITTRTMKATARYTGGTALAPTNNTNEYHGDVTSAVLLANVYAELGTYSGFTPYVGAGAGVAYNHMSNIYEYASWTGSSSGTNFGIIPGGSKWSPAWALHAGFAYDLSPNLKLDVGYSYKDLGKVASVGNSNCNTSGCLPESIELKRIQNHSLHVGARWMFDAPAPRQHYSAPVIAKY